MSKMKMSLAGAPAPAPVLLCPPARSADASMPLTPRIIWKLVTDFVLSQTDGAASVRGELDAFNPESYGDEDDRNDTINRFHDAHAQRAGHAATLDRLSFWRRCVLVGVPRDELLPRAGELWELAHEVCADRPVWQWAAMDARDLINAMRPDYETDDAPGLDDGIGDLEAI